MDGMISLLFSEKETEYPKSHISKNIGFIEIDKRLLLFHKAKDLGRKLFCLRYFFISIWL